MLKYAFLGSGGFAACCLERLSQRLKPQWAVTNAPHPAGRGMELRPTPVQLCAEKLSVPFRTTEKLSSDEELLEWIKADVPDVMLVIDFGHIVREPLLSLARLGCLNAHPSRLPQYRGSAPVQRAVMDGLTETAVTIFRLDAGMDSGPILAQLPVAIEKCDTSGSLLRKCAELGADALARYLCEVPEHDWKFTPQPAEGVSFAPKIDKAEGRIDWNEPSARLSSLVRGIGEAPGVFCMARGKRLRVHEAVPLDGPAAAAGTITAVADGFPIVACGVGGLKLLQVQPEGKKAQSAAEWLRGCRLNVGDKL